MTLTIVLPSRNFATSGFAFAAASISAGVAATGTVMRPRSLPSTCTGSSISSSTSAAASYAGHGS